MRKSSSLEWADELLNPTAPPTEPERQVSYRRHEWFSVAESPKPAVSMIPEDQVLALEAKLAALNLDDRRLSLGDPRWLEMWRLGEQLLALAKRYRVA